MGKKQYRDKLLDVRKDRLDLRDREYRPILKSLPEFYPNFRDIGLIVRCYKEFDMVLDQGANGACTGYALASMVNYLLWRKLISKDYDEFVKNPLDFKINKVSQKMFYNLARIYDEWNGEDYNGSSCRGAMKGWHKHGVCEEKIWKFDEDEPADGWAEQAVERPLGAYYRVDKNSIDDMQSALCEVGALYVSASVHDGWWELKDVKKREIKDIVKDIPYIPYHTFPMGSHAFIIVGYTRYGFIIQNSWGTEWGNSGFAILSYKDWLEHGMDVWVAVIGVPVDINCTPNTYSNLSLLVKNNEVKEGSETIKKALCYGYKEECLKPCSEDIAYQHTLILNSYGRAKHTIVYTSSLERSIEIICYENIKKWMEDSPKNRKVVLYALGGFQDEKEYIAKIRVLLPYFLENGIYPIFLTWQTSYYKEIEKSIDGFFKDILALSGAGVQEKDVLEDRDALDRTIENHCQKISTKAIWSEVKEKSLNVNLDEIEVLNDITEGSGGKKGVLYILTDSFEKLYQDDRYDIEIHAMSHSAGSQLIATKWLTELADRGMRLHSLHLIAPTLTIRDCNDYIIEAQEQALFSQDDIHVYMLDREMESSDNVSKYSHSLLSLISRSLERVHKTPILGLEDAWYLKNTKQEDGIFNTQHLNDMKIWYKFASKGDKRCHKYILKKNRNNLKSSTQGDTVKLSHRNLDKSIFILETILKVIRGKKLKYKVENLC